MGSLVMIGGGLNPENEPVYQTLLELAGPEARIGVLGTASDNPARSAAERVSDLERYGAKAEVLDITVENAVSSTHDPQIRERIAACNGFFFSGGDQRRIVRALLGTPALAAIRARSAAGAVVAGTSAGAAMMSETMISGGNSLDTLVGGPDPLTLEAGLGFVRGIITDQHFLARGRFGRLAAALERSKIPLGVGVDEDTALVIPERGPWKVVGSSYAAILERDDPDTLISLIAQGDTFDPVTRAFTVDERRAARLGYSNEAGAIGSSGIFGPNTLTDLLTRLVDSPEQQAIGLDFQVGVGANFVGDGIRVIFSKTPQTRGYHGRSRYSVIRVGMKTEKIRVSVASDAE